MNWVSKKVILSKLKSYFFIENQNDISISLLGRKQIKCSNLALKPEAINTQELPVHVQNCYIKTLDITYGTSDDSEQPLQIKIDSVKLTLKFNTNRKFKWHSYQNKKRQRPILKQFYRAVGSEQEYTQRTFLQEEIYQLKRIFGEMFISKLAFSISNIDVSFMCIIRNKPLYVGLKIEVIDIKHKIIVKETKKEISISGENRQLHGELRNIGIYIAKDVENEFDVKKLSALQKQTKKKRSRRHKKYLMNKDLISIFYNFDEKHLAIFTKSLTINIEEILFFELKEIVDYLQKASVIRPLLRPGQGKIKIVGEQKMADSQGTVYTKQIQVSEGTLEWWQVFGSIIMNKFNRRQNLNIIRNKKFKRYLFCLLYRYTFGAKAELEDIVEEYQFFKEDIQIIKYNRFIIERVHGIQVSKSEEIQLKGFLMFLKTILRTDKALQKLKLQNLTYDAIKGSNVISNLQNCKKFMRIYDTNIHDSLNIDIKINSFKINICQSKQSLELKNNVCRMNPSVYDLKKKEILGNYCDALIINTSKRMENSLERGQNSKFANFQESELKRKTSIYEEKVLILFQFCLTNFAFELNPNNSVYFRFEELEINDTETAEKIAKIRNFFISLQSMHPQIYRWQISVEQRFQMRIDLIYFFLDIKFLQKCLMIKSFVTPPLIQQKVDTRNFISKFIAKKIPHHRIFEIYSNMSKNVLIKECFVTVPVLQKNRVMELMLKRIEFQDPINQKQVFGISQIFLTRSNLENQKQRFKKTYRKEMETDKSILLVNTQPLTGFSSVSPHNQLMYLFLPFFLVQFSCQDIYYIQNILKSLSFIFANPFYFPPPLIKKDPIISEIKQTSIEFTKKMQQKIERTKTLELKFQGIQFYLVTDVFYEPNNKIIGVLVDFAHLKKAEKYFQDTVEFSIKDIYINNCLQDKMINIDELVKSIKGSRNLDDKSIIEDDIKEGERQSRHSIREQGRVGDLLLYSEERNSQKTKQEQFKMQNGFLYVQTKSEIYVEEQKSINKILMKIVPLFIFHNEKFFEEILTVFSVINSLSVDLINSYFQSKQEWTGLISTMASDNLKSTTYMNEILPQEEEIQILKSRQFQEMTYLVVSLQRLNFLVNQGDEVVLNVTLKNLQIKHKTELYMKKFNFSIGRLIIIDTSDQAGPYPIIIDAMPKSFTSMNQIIDSNPVVGYYTQYGSEILRHKQNKSALFYLKIIDPQIYFLKKKVLELTNLIMNTLNKTLFRDQQKQNNSDQQYQSETEKKNMDPKKFYEINNKDNKVQEPGFCYYVEIAKPTIKLIRGSLADEGFDSRCSSIIVSNFTNEPYGGDKLDEMQELTLVGIHENNITMNVDVTKLEKTDKNIDRMDQSFRSCSRIEEDNFEHFQSFSRIEKARSSSNDIIYIKLDEFVIRGSEFWGKNVKPQNCRPMTSINSISMEFKNSNLNIFIPFFEADFTQEDYRILIRLTQDNFGETPLTFINKSPPSHDLKVSIRSSFQIAEMLLSFRTDSQDLQVDEQNKNLKNIALSIECLKGKNEIWTNSENQTELSISKLTFLKFNGEQFMCKQQSIKVFEENQIAATDLQLNEDFKGLEHINKKIWKKLKASNGDYFQLFQTDSTAIDINPDEIIKGHAIKETHAERIRKWIAGMCKKCLKCCNCCVDQKDDSDIDERKDKNETSEMLEEQEGWSEQNLGSMSGQKNRNISLIYELGQILEFEDKISDKKIDEKKTQDHVVYLDFVIKPNGEKHMYMQVKNLEITLEKQNALMSAINFLKKPYAGPQIPPYFRIPKFNNFKPFKMVIEVNDTSLKMKNVIFEEDEARSQKKKSDESYHEIEQSLMQERQEQIVFLLNTVYHSQSKGDNLKGPGKSLLKIQTLLQMLFVSDKFEKPIQLSDKIKISYDINQVTPYGNEKKKRSNQRILIIPYGKDKQDTLHIKLPIFLMKSFNRIMKNSFETKKKDNVSSNDQTENENMNLEPEQNMIIKSNKKEAKKSASEVSVQNVPAKSLFVSRVLFVPDLCLDIEYNVGNPFLQTEIKKVQYAEAQYVEPTSQLSVRNVKSITQIKYWNLKMGKFQPCLEPWGFKIQHISTLRDGITGNQLQIESDLTKKNFIDDVYYNDLNLNVSVALFQTYKELMIKYEEEDNQYIQICYDLTSIQSKDCNVFADANTVEKKFNKPDFPAELKTFFGRLFHCEQIYSTKKNLKMGNKTQFNPKQLKVYVFHSYFDHLRRKKRLTYRTPFRIFNSSNIPIWVNFICPKKQLAWNCRIKIGQYYSVPDIIYAHDFLVHFNRYKPGPEDYDLSYVSMRYLMETRSKTKRFQPMSLENKIWKTIFKYSSRSTDKLLSYFDLVINMLEYKFVVITVKGVHKVDSQRQGYLTRLTHDNKLYDTYGIIVSPMIIENYSYNDLQIKINRSQTIKIPSNQRVEINQYFSEDIYETIFEFQEDNFHKQYQFFKFEKVHSEINMEIDKLQSFKLKIYRQTASTCQIQIYSDWNIENRTNHDFSMRFLDRVFLVDRMSFSCLSDFAGTIDFSIIGEQMEYSRKIKTNNVVGQVILGKKVELSKKLQLAKNKPQKCCSCLTNRDDIYENIQFVLNLENDQIFPASKRLEIKYKYQIRNLTQSAFKLYQQNEQFLIADLSHFQDTSYIFFYDFLPKMYFLSLILDDDKTLQSCKFDLKKVPGTSFAIKIRKQGADIMDEYYKKFYYFVINIKRNGQEIFIDILDADFENFPIYLDNLTDYMIQITAEGSEEFTLKPRQRMPFAWSELIQEKNKFEVTIENTPTMTYEFNQKEAFQPITIVDKNKKKRKKNANNLYKKEICYVNYQYMNIVGTCLLILDSFDNKLRIHNSQDSINVEIDMEKIQRMQALASNILMYNESNHLIEIIPGSKSIKSWKEALHQCINENVVDKIFFTIESYKNSRFFFFRTILEDDNQSNKTQVSIKNLNLSVISSTPEEIVLLNCEEFGYSQHDRINKLNYKNLAEQISERVFTIKKMKICNQVSVVNPVVLSQIKKSNTPFLQIRLSKMNLLTLNENKIAEHLASAQKIVHYKEITVFMDEAEVMVEAGLFSNLMQIRSNIDYLANQYAVGDKKQQKNEEKPDEHLMVSNKSSGANVNKKLVNLNAGEKQAYKDVVQVYINFIQIKPIKMTVSINMEHHTDQKIEKNIISFLRYIPLGVQNAIIEIDSFTFFHVFFDEQQLTRLLTSYYMNSIYYQIIYNAGSYDMLAPIKIVEGVGVGVKNIFYDPFYEFVKKKQIKAVGKKLCEGIISLIVLILTAIIRIISIIFKLIAMLTFDRDFRTKRETFRKQIFKSPLDGVILGAKNLWKVFKSFFIDFTKIGQDYSQYFLGYVWGFFICIIKVIPWIIKLIVSLYDFVYVIGLGFVNWGYYEESAMKNRSRPPRIMKQNLLSNYNYRYSYGNELIKRNHLQQIQNEQIYFVKKISKKDQYTYLILSNYRILYNNNKITSCNEIKLYQVKQIITKQIIKQNKNEIVMTIVLSIYNTNKILCIGYNVEKYEVTFSSFKDSMKFIRRLENVAKEQKLDIQFVLDENMKRSLDLKDGMKMMCEAIKTRNSRDLLMNKRMIVQD